ncbi:hypothetical protein N0V92_012845 [Colletotrichum tropicale]|nr:hypothetical protein N0V92_012845 [Colletotrichum tropicale]
MVRALLIAALASVALAIPVPVPVPTDGPALADNASIPTAEELETPALAVPAQADDAAESARVDNGDEGGVEDVSEPKLPVQRRVVDTDDLDTSAFDTSGLNTDSLTTALPTTNTKRGA